MSVCQMCGAALPESATAGRKYCADCIKKRRAQQNHDAWERGRQKREAAKAKITHPCKRCGEPILGRALYCTACRDIVRAESDRKSKEKQNEKKRQETERRRMQGHPCWICGDMMYNDLHVRYCSECEKIAKRQRIPKNKAKAMEVIEGIKAVQQVRAERALEASYKCKERRFSMQFSFDELIRLASTGQATENSTHGLTNTGDCLRRENNCFRQLARRRNLHRTYDAHRAMRCAGG